MNFSQLDLNLLVALDALLTEKSVTQAGLRINLSQSAMSGSLARLREYFGDELLIQVGRRRMVRTPLAESLAQPVHEILAQIRAAIALKRDFTPATCERNFTVIASDLVTILLLADVIREVQRQAPGITFEIRDFGADFLLDLESGVIDFVICPEGNASAAHPKAELFEIGYTGLVWAENSLVGEQLDFEQYLKLDHVVTFFERSRGPGFFEGWFMKQYGYRGKPKVVAANFTTVPYLIAGTNRIATVHAPLASIYRKIFPLRTIALPFTPPALVESLQWHRGQESDPAHAWVRAIIRARAAELRAAGPGVPAPAKKPRPRRPVA